MKRSTVFILAAFILALALPMAADDGAVTFGTKCAVCHGKAGAADTPMGKAKKIKDLASPEVQKMTDAQLTEKISGHTKGLTADQIKAAVSFIRTLKK